MSLINTRIQNVRAEGNLDKNENRPSRYGALDLFMVQTKDPSGIITPDLEAKATTSIGNTLETPVIDYDGSISIGNTRSVTIADSENTSQMQTITFATYSWGFTIVPSLFMNNEVSMQRDFATKMKKYNNLFFKTLDSACISSLSTNKSQVFADSLSYTVTGNKVIAPWAARENVIGDLNPILEANDHFDQIHLLGNGGLQSVLGKLAQGGLYNAENKQLEYADKVLHFSNRIANAEGEYANMYAVQAGSVGLLTRFERESLLNTTMADGTSWGIDTLPGTDFPVGTYFYESKGDFSAIAGAASADMTRARKEHYGFAVDVAYVTTYNSDNTTIANPIVAATIQSGDSYGTPVTITNTTDNPIYTSEVV